MRETVVKAREKREAGAAKRLFPIKRRPRPIAGHEWGAHCLKFVRKTLPDTGCGMWRWRRPRWGVPATRAKGAQGSGIERGG